MKKLLKRVNQFFDSVEEGLRDFFTYPLRVYHSWVVKLAVRLLKNLDGHMIQAHWPRAERRRFWREFFYSKEKRGEVEELLIGENGKKKRRRK